MGGPKGDRVDDMIHAWEQERADLDVGALAVTARLLRIGRILQGRLDKIATEHGLSHKGDLDVLTALRRSGDPHELTPTQLAGAVQVTAGGMTIRLDRLETAALVVRRPNPRDRRGVIVTLTDKGRAVADRAFDVILAEQKNVMSCLTDREARQMAEGLRTLLVSLGDKVDRPPAEGTGT